MVLSAILISRFKCFITEGTVRRNADDKVPYKVPYNVVFYKNSFQINDIESVRGIELYGSYGTDKDHGTDRYHGTDRNRGTVKYLLQINEIESANVINLYGRYGTDKDHGTVRLHDAEINGTKSTS